MMKSLALALLASAALAAPALAQKTDKAAVPAGVAAAAAKPAPSGDYVVDKTHASLTFKIKHMGLSNYTARFTGLDAQLNFDEANVAKSKLTATVDIKTIETDFAKTRPAANTVDFNGELAGEKWMNAEKFPQATFVSKTITKTGPNKGKAVGDLTFMGVTKPATLDITFNGHRPDPRAQKERLGFSATGSLKRSDFGFNAGKGFLDDEVDFAIEAEFLQK